MRKKGNYGFKILFLAVLCFIGMIVVGQEAQASSRMTTLKAGQNYQTALTGSKKRTIRYTTNKASHFQGMTLYIDGKRQLSFGARREAFSWDVKLCQVSSSRTLIYIADESFNSYTQGITFYEYKNNKFRKLFDLGELTRDTSYTFGRDKPSKAARKKSVALNGWARGDLVRVGKNTVTINWRDDTSTTGWFSTNITYRVKGNKATRVGNSYKPIFSKYEMGVPTKTLKKLTTNRAFQTYTKAGGTKRAFRVKRNQKVQIVAMRAINGQRYIQIRNSKGKTGWYRDTATSGGGWFKEAIFAG